MARVAPLVLLVVGALSANTAQAQTKDTSSFTVSAKGGPIRVWPIKHASVMLEFRGKTYYVDPASLPGGAEYKKADAILITHEHGDHLDPQAIKLLRKPGTTILANPNSVTKLGEGQPIRNGEKRKLLGIEVEAVPAYNVVRTQYHPKGRDNGYVLTVGGTRIYFAGDTENIPEMKRLKGIDLAFLPINLPYTMPPAEAAQAALAFRPKLLVPYHQGQSNPQDVAQALKGSGIGIKVLSLP
jgi:L-ascorbate metabolism protein UlaG (beta-lactamase superfamily)